MQGARMVVIGTAIMAALALTGCVWSGAAGTVGLVVLVLALIAGCGGQAIGQGPGSRDDGNAGDSGTVPDAKADTDPGCGHGHCPAGMDCVVTPDGPWCLPDADMDEVLDGEDNCPYASNFEQQDADGDNVGDACDLCVGANDEVSCGEACCNDPDGDLVPGYEIYGPFRAGQDNCPFLPNQDQADRDEDGIGDACDLCPDTYHALSPCGDPCLDSDGDGVADIGFCGSGDIDSCLFTPSDHLQDADGDNTGDVCDPDGIAQLARVETGETVRHTRRETMRLASLERFAQRGVLDRATVAIASRRS